MYVAIDDWTVTNGIQGFSASEKIQSDLTIEDHLRDLNISTSGVIV